MSGYDFSTLSPSDFERLVCDVLNAELGLNLRTYPAGRDQGIDLREVTSDGAVIVGQCKHYARSGPKKLLNAVKAETLKSGYKTADRYLFATTRPMSPEVEASVAETLAVPPSDVWGPNALNDLLRAHPEVVKAHFKLWLSSTAELERIVHAGLWNRRYALLEEIADEAKFWVETPSYTEASEMLGREAVCIITGLPGTGKSFLANRLVLDHVSEGWQLMKIVDGPRDAWDLWDPEAKQLFVFDDFLGQAKLKLRAVDQSADLLDLIKRVRRHRGNKRMIMTSREQIMRQAAQEASDRLEEVTLDPARCAISLQDLDVATKVEILATHLFFSELAEDEYERIRTNRRLLSLAQHPSYSPRVVQEVTQRVRENSTTNQVLDELEQTFANPQKLWWKSFTPLTEASQELLLTFATLPPRPFPLKLLRTLSEFTGSTVAWHQALKTLEPTWIRLVETSAEKTVVFSNPSCRDFLLGLLNDPEHAEDRLNRLKRMDQLVNLTHAASLTSVKGRADPSSERGHLARALLERREQLAAQTERWVEELTAQGSDTQVLRTFYNASSLLAVFGNPETNTYLLNRVFRFVHASVDGAIRPLPTSEALALADRLGTVALNAAAMRDARQAELIIAGLLGAQTSRDLVVFEGLPVTLWTEEVREVALKRAEDLFTRDLELLLGQHGEPGELLAEGNELKDRAQHWYGIELSLGDLLDHVAALADS